MSDMSGYARIEQLDKKILDILYRYVGIRSITLTPGENQVPGFFRQCLEHLPYYTQHPDHLGTWQIEKDEFDRKVCWAMLKGGSNRCVVMIHHYDVVVADNYGPLKELAFDPQALETALKSDPGMLDPGAGQDLDSDLWLFGRGTADMKGGGAIQLALLEHYARMSPEQRKTLPTLVVLGVPDEENLSAGMRGALGLLCRLQERFGLDYRLMLNSEPHQRLTPEKGLISQGSIGKLNMFVYVKGVMAHAGKALEGLNPTGLLSEIVGQTDLSFEFTDQCGEEICTPPTWILLRDVKKHYDISFPQACYGMFNVLHFDSGPKKILDQMIRICRRVLGRYVEKVNNGRRKVSKITGQSWPGFAWEERVLAYGDLPGFDGTPDVPGTFEDELELATRNMPAEDPLIVVGFCPPYYPGVANPDQSALHEKVRAFTLAEFDQDYDNQAYYTGISDLSYVQMSGDKTDFNAAMAHMANTRGYHIPFDLIEKISMPCVNIGPWGKDFHKPSERVFKPDLLCRTPGIIDHIIRSFK